MLLSSSTRVVRALVDVHDCVSVSPFLRSVYFVSPRAETTPAGVEVPVTLKATPEGVVVFTSSAVEPMGKSLPSRSPEDLPRSYMNRKKNVSNMTTMY